MSEENYKQCHEEWTTFCVKIAFTIEEVIVKNTGRVTLQKLLHRFACCTATTTIELISNHHKNEDLNQQIKQQAHQSCSLPTLSSQGFYHSC